jgi:gluconate 2-dehydrogenase gamma chain
MPWQPSVADQPYYGTESSNFLTHDERSALDALTSRLIPTDDTGPGAREADVVTFIDRQLAGYYGAGQRWYMQGPFSEPLETQGYQSEQPPAQLIRDGLVALDAYCRSEYEARGFASLSEVEQDEILTALDEGDVEFEGLSAKAFFDFVHEITVEGFFADPIYGGNRDMVGWHLVGFPGARYDYRDYLGHNGAAIEMPPVGLMGRPEWNSQRG